MKFVLLLIGLLVVGSAAEKDYTDLVNFLKQKISDSSSKFYHSAYDRLAYLSDTYGARLWGSQALEHVIDQVYEMAKKQGFDNVKKQPVQNFTKWIRGEEELILHDPRPVPTPLKLIGLGGTVSGHIKAQAIVVNNFAELQARKDEIAGKIVVYNQTWTTYGEMVQYRSSGASRASKYGAIGALVKSVTPDSIQSVHTGIQHYASDVRKIPVAAMTVEDAEMLARMQARKQKIVLQLRLQNQIKPNASSSNVVFDITGTENPEQILLMGGHIDSWDTGSQTGANDDGGGFITCFEAMRLLLQNGFRPRRTIRFIAWSGEEWGDPNNGAHAYIATHKDELQNHIVAFEDDLGSTKLYGFGYSGSSTGKAIVQEVSSRYLGILNASFLSDDGHAVDTGPLLQMGIPTMINLIEDTPDHEYYFTFHHSAGDTMSIMNPNELDSNVVGVAAMFYILADLEKSIPKPDIKIIDLQ